MKVSVRPRPRVYRLSIEGFANRVKELPSTASFPAAAQLLCGRGAASSRSGDRSRLLNLQTVVEKPGDSHQRRASVFVTSQADLEESWARRKGCARPMISARSRAASAPSHLAARCTGVIQRRLWKRIRWSQMSCIPRSMGPEKGQPPDPVPLRRTTPLAAQGLGRLPGLLWPLPRSPVSAEPVSKAGAARDLASTTCSAAATWRWLNARCSSCSRVAKAHHGSPIANVASFDQLYDGIRDCDRGDKQQGTMVLAGNARCGWRRLNLRHPQRALFLLKWCPVKALTYATLRSCCIRFSPISTSAPDEQQRERALRQSGSAELPGNAAVALRSSSPTRKRMWSRRFKRHPPWKGLPSDGALAGHALQQRAAHQNKDPASRQQPGIIPTRQKIDDAR